MPHFQDDGKVRWQSEDGVNWTPIDNYGVPGGAKVWQPPTGAHDALDIGDYRWHEGQVWRSKIDGNTTVPGDDSEHWETVEVLPLLDKIASLEDAVDTLILDQLGGF